MTAEAPPPPNLNTKNPAELEQRLTYDSYFDSTGAPVDAGVGIDTMHDHAEINKNYARVVDGYAEEYVQDTRTRAADDPDYLANALSNGSRSKNKLIGAALSNGFIEGLVVSPSRPHYDVLLSHIAKEDDPSIKKLLHPEIALTHAPYSPARETTAREERAFEGLLDDIVARADDITRVAGSKRETMAAYEAKLVGTVQQLNTLLLARPDRARAIRAQLAEIRGHAQDDWVDEAKANVDAVYQKQGDLADESQGYRDAWDSGNAITSQGLKHNSHGILLPKKGHIRRFRSNARDRRERVLPALDRERSMPRKELDALIARGRGERAAAQAEFVQNQQSDILLVLEDVLDAYAPAFGSAESKHAASFEARHGTLEMLEAGIDGTLDDWRLDEGVNEYGAEVAEYTSFRQLKGTARYIAELQATLKEVSPSCPWYDQLAELYGRVTRVHNVAMYKRGQLLVERSIDSKRAPAGFAGRIRAHYNKDKSLEYDDGLHVRRYPDGSYAYTAPGNAVIDRRNPDGSAWVDSGDWAVPPHIPDTMPSWLLYREQQTKYAEWFKDQASPRACVEAQALSHALAHRLNIDALQDPGNGDLMEAASKMVYRAHFIGIEAGRTHPADLAKINPNGTVSLVSTQFVRGDSLLVSGLWTFHPNGARVVKQPTYGQGPIRYRTRSFDPQGNETSI